jgi:ubiquinone/menaquinone biosynthesis C-methylase UbiE
MPLPSEVVRIAPCVAGPEAYAAAAASFVRASLLLPQTSFGSSLRTLVCCEMFHATEGVLAQPDDPIPRFKEVLLRYGALMEAAARTPRGYRGRPPSRKETLELQTARHYGRLFSQFDTRHYYDEAYSLLRERLARNGFDRRFPRGRMALDAGCGGGRYTVSLRRLGFQRVIGVDFSEQGIRDAKSRLRRSRIAGVSFRRGSVLDLPFRDGSFDFAFSNGVLHHTKDMARGFRELLRVLRPGGRGFVYVIEKPGGIFWDAIEVLRVLMKRVSHDAARETFKQLGVPTNRTFYILDHVMAPINVRSTPPEVETLLVAAGAADIRRLDRGARFDRVERIHRGEPHIQTKVGVGENRYFFAKP